MSMHPGPSLPACFTLADALTHAAFTCRLSILHRRVSMAINASCPPKIKQAAPMATTIDLPASKMVSGGVGDEESASIDDRCDGCDRGGGSGRCRRLWGPGSS